MTTAHFPVVPPDQIACLPPSCRRGGGRSHVPFWTVDARNDADDLGSTTFSACSIEPRTIVNFGRRRLTFSFISRKTGTLQQGEGPWELLLAKWLEAEPTVTDYQFHNIASTFTRKDAVIRTYGPDATWATADGRVVCAEVKASEGYFAEPDVRSLCDSARAGFSEMGIAFAEVTGDDLQSDRRRAYNVGRAFVDRMTAVSARQIADTCAILDGDGTAMGRLGEVLGTRPSATIQTVNSLVVTRHAAYDMSLPVTMDTIVTAAPTARRGVDIRAIGR